MDFWGGDVEMVPDVASMGACRQQCLDVAACHACSWVPDRGECYLDEAAGWERRETAGVQSATLVDPGPAAGA